MMKIHDMTIPVKLRIDVIPAKAGLTAELDANQTRIRFTAYRVDADGAIVDSSQPSGWFDLANAPISLTWDAFEWAEGVDRA